MMPAVKAGSLFVPFPCFTKQLPCPSSVPCIGRFVLLPLLLQVATKVQVAMH